MQAMIQPIEGQMDLTKEVGSDTLGTILSLEELAKRSNDKLESLKDDVKKARMSLDNALEGNEEYASAVQQVRAAQRVKKEAKNRAMANPTLIRLATELSDLQFEKKETQLSLSDYILEYERHTQQLPLFGDDYVIVKLAKVKKIKKRK